MSQGEKFKSDRLSVDPGVFAAFRSFEHAEKKKPKSKLFYWAGAMGLIAAFCAYEYVHTLSAGFAALENNGKKEDSKAVASKDSQKQGVQASQQYALHYLGNINGREFLVDSSLNPIPVDFQFPGSDFRAAGSEIYIVMVDGKIKKFQNDAVYQDAPAGGRGGATESGRLGVWRRVWAYVQGEGGLRTQPRKNP